MTTAASILILLAAGFLPGLALGWAVGVRLGTNYTVEELRKRFDLTPKAKA